MATLVLDPVTRIEGHLRIDTRVDGGFVAEAWSRGEMFRGFEALLVGRDPLDAPVITQRICGVCPVSHAVAACRALESALGLPVPDNGRLLRNLVLGANYLQSHVLHFYHLSALDFVDVEGVLAYAGSDPRLREVRQWVENEVRTNRVLPAAPFLPRMAGNYAPDAAWSAVAVGHYLEALEVRQEAHRMAALFGGKMPHVSALVPGGVTSGVEVEAVASFRSRLRRVARFVEHTYLPDVLEVAARFPEYGTVGRGGERYLSYGAFEEEAGAWLPGGTLIDGAYQELDTARIAEETGASRYAPGEPRHPSRGETLPDAERAGAYSWLKAPRYAGQSCEVGPLARILVASAAGFAPAQDAVEGFLRETGLSPQVLPSALGRHAVRALEASVLARQMETWLDQLTPGEPSVGVYHRRTEGSGEGLVEAPRGALGHWIRIESGKTARYQCLVPSTWNFSPRDDQGRPGPVEEALVGTPVDPAFDGVEVARVVRSFDPCIACAVH